MIAWWWLLVAFGLGMWIGWKGFIAWFRRFERKNGSMFVRAQVAALREAGSKSKRRGSGFELFADPRMRE